MQVADLQSHEYADVRALNEASVPHVNSLSPDDIAWFAARANYFRVARIDGELAGFLIGLGPGLDYASVNYQYFCSRHAVFGYVDRVVVAATARRQGVGSRLYDDYQATLRGFVPILTCEMNLMPPKRWSKTDHKAHRIT